MNKRSVGLMSIATLLITACPALAAGNASTAHVNPHTVGEPIYCTNGHGTGLLDEYGAVSRFVMQSHHLTWQGGVHDTENLGQSQSIGVGFELENAHESMDSFSFSVKSSGTTDGGAVLYEYNSGQNFDIQSKGVQSSTNGKGVTRWSFNRANSGLDKGLPVTGAFFIDSGNASQGGSNFTDTAFDILVNHHDDIEPTHTLEEDCVFGS